MATLTEAERARKQMAEYLRRLGAHAIGVEALEEAGNKKERKARGAGDGFGVIAYFTEPPKTPLPEVLEVRSGSKRLKVPLALRLAPRFQLE